MSNSIYDYTIGGNVAANNLLYVKRQADDDFYTGLKNGEFCYVLNARQMGKSSLRVRIDEKLKAEGVICVNIDITEIGSLQITPVEWYAGIIAIIAKEANITDFDLNQWWEQHRLVSPVQHLSKFLSDILLARTTQPIVIFVDESDGIRRFGQDFFVLIRACYNQRADKPAYQRLTFGILGVASPGDLIADKTITPFNIGRGIELCGFTLAEAMPLAKGLAAKSSRPEALLAIVLAWTGGQPFLTQKLCQRISLCERPLVAGEEAGWVENIVQTDFLEHWESQDEPMHLRHIRDRILHEGGQTTGRLLGIYQQILQHGAVLADASREQLELRLSCLVVKRQNQLVVYNPIYAQVFNQAWVVAALAKLRPYAETFNAWVASGGQDESRLLQGQALQEAQAWAKEKHVGDEDYKFLAASHQLETRVLQRQKRWQRRAIWGLVLFLGITAGLMVVAGWQWQVAQQLKDKGLRTQSLFLADLSRQETEKGNATNGILLALEALPKTLDSPERPYVNEAKLALYDAVVKNRELKVLTGHTAAIKSAAISPDGQLMATASADGTARLWEMNTGKLRYVFKGQGKEERMNQVAFSPDGQRLLVASSEGVAYLWEVKSGKRLMVLEGHQGSIESAAFSPNGERIVTASADKTARLWEAHTGKLLAVLQGVHHATFSLDGRRVLTTGSQLDKPEEITGSQMDEEMDEEVARMREALDFVATVSRFFIESEDANGVKKLFLAGNEDNMANLWDANTGKQIAIFTKPKDKVSHTTFSPDGRRVVTVLPDNTVHLWEVNSGKQLMVFKGHKESVYHTVFSADGQQLLTISSDKTMRLWEVQSGKQLAVMSGYPGGITYAEFSPGGPCVVTASTDNTARLWDTQTGKLLVTFGGHEKKVNQAIFTPKDQRVVTISDDMTARVWDANYYCGSPLDKVQNKSIVLLRGHEGRVNHAAFSPDNQKVVTASEDKTARLWDVNTGKQLMVFKGLIEVSYVDFSADSQRVVTSSGYGFPVSLGNTVHLWDVNTGKQLVVFEHELPIKQATLSSDGQRVVTSSYNGMVRLWDANTGKNIATLQERDSFKLNGQQVITISKDGKVYVWENNTEKQIAVLGKHEESSSENSIMEATVFSPNGKRMVRTNRGNPYLWDAKAGKQLAVLTGTNFNMTPSFLIFAEDSGKYFEFPSEYIGCVAFSPDNKRIITALRSENFALWDADTGQQLMLLKGNKREKSGYRDYATFSPDSSLVLTTSEGNPATLWNVHTGEQVAILNGHKGSILHAAFSPDGQRIVTSSADGTAILWPVFPSTQALLDYAREIVPRQLSCQERGRFFLVEKGECREVE